MASTKTNFAYNLLLTGCNYIFPLITYPYVSRVLGVDNIGLCNYVDGIVNYFTVLSMMGIANYGVREIARCKDDREHRDVVFSNLLAFNIVLAILALIILAICTFTIEGLSQYRLFLGVGSLQIVFNLLLTNWFFQGISEFRFITIRSVVVRGIYVVLVFMLVHEQDDVLIYYSLTIPTIAINAAINWIYGRKFRTFKWKSLNFKPFILPVIVFGIYQILTSMYTTFNAIFLGYIHGNTEVGYFVTATKLYTIVLSVFTALTTVMVPRVSTLLSQGNLDKVQSIASDIISLLLTFSIPIIVFCVYFAHEIVWLISGEGYEGAETPFRIVIFMLIVIGMEQIIIQQFLMASQSNKSVLAVSVTGAIVGLTFNIILTPQLASIGSSLSWGLSEIAVLIVGICLVKRVIGLKIPKDIILKKLSVAMIYIIVVGCIMFFDFVQWTRFIVASTVMILTFYIINRYIDKNTYLIKYLRWKK